MQSKGNKKKVFYDNFNLKKYRSINSIKHKSIKKYLTNENRKERFKNNQILFVLFYKKKTVSFGWMNLKSSWKITEINKIIFKKIIA